MDDNYKLVEFDKCCEDCVYKDVPESEDPCDECLTQPVNLYSKKGVNFKEK